MSSQENISGTPTYLWVPSPERIVVPAGQRVALAQKRSRVSYCTIFADQANNVTVTIGPGGLTVAAGARPNSAYFQLDAGRDAEISTDNVYTEFFDLHEYYAAHADPSLDQILYLTVYRPSLLGVIK